ncbi:IS630 family transposase [Mucilaginibacter sp.]|uniref:IS630 family transposase n=1 Tax=Mucilaginibacter sp. TaxID=1882438 RepID=UPI003267A6DF
MHITKEKKDNIRSHYLKGKVDIYYLAEILELRAATINFYLNEFNIIKEHHPEKLNDFSFFIGKDKVIKETIWHRNLVGILPELVLAEPGPVLYCARLYRKYLLLFPNEYRVHTFYAHFVKWFNQHKNALCDQKLNSKFTPQELAQLKKWRKGNDRRLWQVAVLLMTAYTYHSMGELAGKIECSRHSMLAWLRLYEQKGLQALSCPGSKRPITDERKAAIEDKKDGLIHLVRQQPKAYGIDKPAWTITDLAYVYGKESGHPISHSTVSIYLRNRGVRFKRSREIITSTDPDFRVKYEAIQTILGDLGDKEKFFSIDEYGPCSVRPKGGRQLTIKGEQPVYQKVDKGKGWFICTCALELSTNQLTWFYSRKKNTDEMIRLIEVLILEYNGQERLYLSWDAASWHASQQLLDYLDKINSTSHRMIESGNPEVILAPLPARAPHLNVIESVFSGMSRSVIRNSDYDSLGECTAAIDRYFHKRNLYFKDNPKKAGKKIWGKEKVKPIFDKANICRNLG